MKSSSSLIFTLCLAPLVGTLSAATVVFSEDFESYADTAELGAVWSLGDGTLDTAAGNPGQSLDHPGTGGSFTGANTNSRSFAEITPGAGESILFHASIYDAGTSNNLRVSAGLRLAAGANILEMGAYNNPSHYAYRLVLFGSPTAGWVAFDNLVDDLGNPISNVPVAGWHDFTAEITATQVTFTLDLNSDGNINATATEAITLNAAGGFDIVRLGGPSDLSSTAGGAKFDNVSVTVVPEPASAFLVGLGLLLVGRRRRF